MERGSAAQSALPGCIERSQTRMMAKCLPMCLGTALALTVICIAACGVTNEVIWTADAISSDGSWTATAMTEGVSGPGNNYLGTTVYLKRTKARDRGFEVLGYQENHVPSPGDAPLTMTWQDRTLHIKLKQHPTLNLQVCRYGDVNIVVD